MHQGAVSARFVSKLRLTLTQSSSRRPYKGRPRRPSLSAEHGCNRRAAPALRLDGSGLRARPRAGTARPAARKPRPRPRPTLRPRRGGAEQAASRGSSHPGGRRRHRSSGHPARQGHRLGLRPSGGGAAGLRRPPAASRRFVARASRARGPERCAGGRGWKNKGKKTLGRSCPARWRSRRLAGRALFLQEAAVTRWGRFRRECGVEDDHPGLGQPNKGLPVARAGPPGPGPWPRAIGGPLFGRRPQLGELRRCSAPLGARARRNRSAAAAPA